jgi:hypothetical protein
LFYPEVLEGYPKLFCKINPNIVAEYTSFGKLYSTNTPSEPHKDECHKDLLNLGEVDVVESHSNKYKFYGDAFEIEHIEPPNIFVCHNNQTQEITNDQYGNLKDYLVSLNYAI